MTNNWIFTELSSGIKFQLICFSKDLDFPWCNFILFHKKCFSHILLSVLNYYHLPCCPSEPTGLDRFTVICHYNRRVFLIPTDLHQFPISPVPKNPWPRMPAPTHATGSPPIPKFPIPDFFVCRKTGIFGNERIKYWKKFIPVPEIPIFFTENCRFPFYREYDFSRFYF